MCTYTILIYCSPPGAYWLGGACLLAALGRKSFLFRASVLVIALLALASLHTSSAQPRNHWLYLVAIGDDAVFVKAVVYDSVDERIYMVYRTKSDELNAFRVIAFDEETGRPYTPSGASSPVAKISYTGIGEPTSASIVGDYLFIGTSTGYVVAVNKSTYDLGGNVHVWKASIKESSVVIRHLGYNSGKLVLGVDDPYGVSYVVVATYTPRENVLREELTIRIRGDSVSLSIFSAILYQDYIYAYFSDSVNKPYILSYNINDGTSTVYTFDTVLNTSYRPGMSLDTSQNKLYVAMPLQAQSGNAATFLAVFDIPPAKPDKGIVLGSEGASIYLVNVFMAPNGKLYLAGTLEKEGSPTDALFVELNYNPGDTSNARALRLTGNLDDSITDAHMVAAGRYVYLGALTDSFNDGTVPSSLAILASPGLADKDLYEWQDQPRKSNPAEGLWVFLETLSLSEETPLPNNEGPVAEDVTGSTSFQEVQGASSSESTAESLYLGTTGSEPIPIPEPELLIVASVVSAVIAVMVLWRKRLQV